ncbi:phage tail protein [Dyella caseinilytica]|uniref:Phage tail protein n=1 Tax=Dyella caseinilytica TaxID=1849581 RepID=A0ABX7GUQ0_9GAMM|nr:tail fiber protein [Dyella caseinilytica]QRN53688.1 phage tail protein [Dyella caseinilytica]GFZ88524.1 microcystin dependent protein [Dyella caseinilytica]
MATPYVGEIRLFTYANGRIPVGWLACDGSLQSINAYQTLFMLIGTTYGGDGQTGFCMPDLRGRIPLHQGQGQGLSVRVRGQTGGFETVTLTTPNLPQHTHSYWATTAAASKNVPSNTLELASLNNDEMYTTVVTPSLPALVLAPQSVGVTGGSLPHDNTMPTLPLTFCIAYAGIYPPQS